MESIECGISKKHAYRFKTGNGSKGLIKIQAFNLGVPLSHWPCLVSNDITIFILLVLEDPLGSNDVMILTGRPLHERPYFILGETSEIILHCNEPIRILKCMFNPKWFNDRHK